MEERSVTVGGAAHPLEAPFCVLATQNPIEQVGTYPLPTAQLDRFLFLVHLDYPARDDEARIVRMTVAPPRPESPVPLVRRDDVLAAREAIHDQPAPAAVVAEAVRLARLTRPEDGAPDLVKRYVEYGVSPRAAQQLVRASKARAALRGAAAADISDVRALAAHVFRHRLVLRPAAAVDGIGARDAVDAVLEG
jgi:MoxR-like ATPase